MTMLSQTVEYALRAVVYLANRPGESARTSEIAELTKVPPAYLSKVLQALGREEIVTSRRGIGGGVTLSRDPSELTVLDVVEAVDPIQRINSCPLELKAHGVHLCPLHRRLDNAMKAVEEAFAATTLAEILGEQSVSIPLGDVRKTN